MTTPPSEGQRAAPSGPVVAITNVTHVYGKVTALDNLSLEIPRGKMVGVVGPDGVGKSTLLSLVAGSRKIQSGKVVALDGDMASARHRRDACPRIAYMPQGLGKNLYLELSVRDNVDFMAQLFGLASDERRTRVRELLDATGLGPFPERPAGKLSGGMKQKVGLCGALVHEPDLLILDEPTTGVDPLSRRQFWTLIDDIRKGRPSMSVVIATAYMDEAQRWDWIVAMDEGRVLATGTPAELMQRTGTDNLDDCFIKLLPEAKRAGHKQLVIPPREDGSHEIAIEANGLTQRFGDFTAVDHVTLSIEKGEIFGFLGSNGCGKSTTMKMLTGLLPPTEGTATLFGHSVEAGSMEVRNNLGYMTQAFSLYEELTVRENLVLDARLYHLPPERTKTRIEELVDRFGLRAHLDARTGELPMGLKQRLSLAVAVLHEPKLLILDEPTSGVDPIARDEFWELLADLSRKDGVTIFVTTHFMNEGMRCDRISLMHAGRVLAADAPQKLIEARGATSLEEAFIGYMEDAIAEKAPPKTEAAPPREETVVEGGSAPPENASSAERTTLPGAGGAPPSVRPEQAAARNERGGVEGRSATPAEKKKSRRIIPLPLQRLLAYSRNETVQILRDPIRLAFAFLGSALLMLVFGFGITSDVEHIRYAEYDHDDTPESHQYLEQFHGASRYFERTQPIESDDEALRRLQSDDVSLVVEIPSNFGRDARRGSRPEAFGQADGAMPFRAETVAQYVLGVHKRILQEPGTDLSAHTNTTGPRFQDRYMYNPTFESIYSIVPSVPALLLILIPAILMAVSIVREKELGSIINFYVTPTGRLEYLLGKQAPYIVIGMINFFILAFLALTVFGVSIKGNFILLTACTLLYLLVTTGIGMLTASITKTQVAAVFITAILTIQPTIQFAGLLQPVSTLEGSARTIGSIWPTTYYMHASLGAYTKGLAASLMFRDLVVLAISYPVLLAMSTLGLKKQDK